MRTADERVKEREQKMVGSECQNLHILGTDGERK